ncbi:hypothetical protein TTHERM_00195920 (macronuclear) [Tetrahymena thermophila SB210]|uniref:Uncharacterized protein n=1 Tax=Tetrahymena thermophila (strain SB210) TaxID=312017 RepID=Q23K42_TETTS|nr:hypothetical protein TTHERM_00195920 [Tetrahymena thermophila SB210]EAR97001.2 hypothetical protein TTHERM_00195920 [Tetrahymena thermophila SB210]|eukprot:XP_001017246.2 hypothetical protein TTHERM_00195920 [Tetrahymena thermophila SB210]
MNSNNGATKQIKKTLNLNYLSQISPYITNPSSKNRSKSIKNNSQSINITENEKITQNQQNNQNVIRQSLIHEQLNNQVEKLDKYKFSMSDKKYPTSPGNQTFQNVSNSSASKAIQNSIFAIRSSQKGNQSNMQHRLMVKPGTASNFYQKNNKKAYGNKGFATLSISGVDQKSSGINNNAGYSKFDSSVKMKTEYNIYSDKLEKKILDENLQSMNQTAGSTKRKNSSQIVFNTQASQKDFNVHQSFDNNSFSQMINSYANSVYIPNQNYPSNYIQQSPNTYQSNNFYMSTNSNNFLIAQQQNDFQNTNNSNNIYASQNSGSQAQQNFDNIHSMTHSTNLIEDMPIQDSQVVNSFSKSTNLTQNKNYFPIHSKQASINIASNIQTLSQRSPQIVNPNNWIQQNSQKNNTVYFQLENQSNYNSCLNSINHTHNHSILNGSAMLAVSQSHKSSSKNSQKQSFSIPSSTNQKLNSILKISIQNNQKQKISAMSPNTSNQNSYITNKTNYKKQYNKQKNLSFGSKILQNFLNTQSIDFNQSSQKKPISTPNRVNNSEMGYREKVNSILKGITNQIEQIQFQQQQQTSHQKNSKAYSMSQRISHTMHTQMDTNPSPTSQDKNPIIKTLSQPQLPPQQQQCQINDFQQVNALQQDKQSQQLMIKDPFLKDLEYVSDYMNTLQHNQLFVANIKHPFYFCSGMRQQESQNQKENVKVDEIKQTIQQLSQNKSSISDWKQKMLQKLENFENTNSSFQKQKNNFNSQFTDQQQQKQIVFQGQSLEMQQEYQIYKQNNLNLDQLNSQQNNQIKPSNQLQNILSLNQNFNLNKTNYLKRNNI